MYLVNFSIILKCADITQEDSEGIVNAANKSLLGGGGVDGAIHQAAGPSVMEECKQIRIIQGGCPTGEAVITNGGNLKAKKIIHTVGPLWQGGLYNEAELLANAYKNALYLADANHLKSLSFPSISTGVYGFPIRKAAPIALSTIHAFLENTPDTSLKKICIVLFSSNNLAVYQSV